MKSKFCGVCEKTKPADEFTKNKSSKDGLYSMCSACKSARQRKQSYGIEDGEYLSRLVSQNFCCAICDLPQDQVPRKKLFVDHCHTTGEVRGLLCQACNFVLGQAKDSQTILANAIQYLEDHEARS